MYRYLRPLIFKLDPEQAHKIALTSLQWAHQFGLSRHYPKIPDHPKTVMGLIFPNQVGLSAGFDRNAAYIDALAALGFGFIEIGTIVRNPQLGNPKPRIFRLEKENAIINRMGFASKGLAYALQQLAHTRYRGILGINIGKSKDTPNEKAIDDYVFLFNALWKYASYITINISSPNTVGLRNLQETTALEPILTALKQEQAAIAAREQKYVPLVVKIAPDLSEPAIDEMAKLLMQVQVDGVIACNTSITRNGVQDSSFANEIGGLSGQPITALSLQVIKQLQNSLRGKIPIIASGGIMNETAGKAALAAGASLLQIYTGFIYEGPGLIKRLANL